MIAHALPEDLVNYIAQIFAPEQHAEALHLLGQACMEDGTAASPRLLRCAAFASRGHLAQLRRLVAMLALDWRDVVVAGEYEQQGAALVAVRDFEQPLPNRADRAGRG